MAFSFNYLRGYIIVASYLEFLLELNTSVFIKCDLGLKSQGLLDRLYKVAKLHSFITGGIGTFIQIFIHIKARFTPLPKITSWSSPNTRI
jgi:hypothetical protein